MELGLVVFVFGLIGVCGKGRIRVLRIISVIKATRLKVRDGVRVRIRVKEIFRVRVRVWCFVVTGLGLGLGLGEF